jgi:hypothetical protein
MTKPAEQVKGSRVEANDIAEDVREAQRIAQAQEPGETDGNWTMWIQRKKPR